MIRRWRSGHIATYEQVTAVLIAVVAAFLICAYLVNPAHEAEERIAAPIARDLGLIASHCPNGWNLDTASSQDARVQSCSRGEWRVWLNEKGQFSHGWNGKSPDFVFTPSEVPGWQ